MAGEGEAYWNNAGALVDFVAAHIPKAARWIFSVTAGGTWREHSRQNGSALYICPGDEKLSGTGCYDMTTFEATPREKADYLPLGKALLHGEGMRFYQSMEQLGGENYKSGAGRVCLDPHVADELYKIQHIIDDEKSAEKVIEKWVQLEGTLGKFIERGLLTRCESVCILEPIVRELTKLAGWENAGKAYAPAVRFLLKAKAENVAIDKRLEEALEAFLIGTETIREKEPGVSGLQVLSREIDADKDLTKGEGGDELAKLAAEWLKKHRSIERPTKDEEAIVQKLTADDYTFAQNLKDALRGYAVVVLGNLDRLEANAGVSRLKALMDLLLNAHVTIDDSVGGKLLALLEKWYSASTLPGDVLDRLLKLGGVNEACSGASLIARHLTNALKNGCTEKVNEGVTQTLLKLPEGEAGSTQEALGKWLNGISEFSKDEISALLTLEKKRTDLKLTELIFALAKKRIELSEKSAEIKNWLDIYTGKKITVAKPGELIECVIGHAKWDKGEIRDICEEALCKLIKDSPDDAENVARCLAGNEKKQHNDNTVKLMKGIKDRHKLGCQKPDDDVENVWYGCRVQWAEKEYRESYKACEPMALAGRVKSDWKDAKDDCHREAWTNVFFEGKESPERRLLKHAQTFEDVENVSSLRDNALGWYGETPDDADELKLMSFAENDKNVTDDKLFACLADLNALNADYRAAAARMVKGWGEPNGESYWLRFLLYTLDGQGNVQWKAYFKELYSAENGGVWEKAIHSRSDAADVQNWLNWQRSALEKPEAAKVKNILQDSFEAYARGIKPAAKLAGQKQKEHKEQKKQKKAERTEKTERTTSRRGRK